MYVHVYALPFHVCRGQRTALAISFLIPLWDSGISLLTETKINRNVKKNLMVMTTAFFSVTTGWRQRAHRKKLPLRKSSKESDVTASSRPG